MSSIIWLLLIEIAKLGAIYCAIFTYSKIFFQRSVYEDVDWMQEDYTSCTYSHNIKDTQISIWVRSSTYLLRPKATVCLLSYLHPSSFMSPCSLLSKPLIDRYSWMFLFIINQLSSVLFSLLTEMLYKPKLHYGLAR